MHYRLKKMAHMASGEVLDIGYAFHPNPFLQGEVVGLDLQEAPKPENYARTIVMDAERLLDLNEKFDTVIAGEVIEHLFNPYQFLSGIYTVLNEGGKVILSSPTLITHQALWLKCCSSAASFTQKDMSISFYPDSLFEQWREQVFMMLKCCLVDGKYRSKV